VLGASALGASVLLGLDPARSDWRAAARGRAHRTRVHADEFSITGYPVNPPDELEGC